MADETSDPKAASEDAHPQPASPAVISPQSAVPEAEAPARKKEMARGNLIAYACSACAICLAAGMIAGYLFSDKMAARSCSLASENLETLSKASVAGIADATAQFSTVVKEQDRTIRELYASILAVNAALEESSSRLAAAKAGKPLPPRKGGFVVVNDEQWQAMIEKNLQEAEKWARDHPDSGAAKILSPEYGTRATDKALNGK